MKSSTNSGGDGDDPSLRETIMDSNEIKFIMSEDKNYDDGFAEGYSRGWIECWDYLRENFRDMISKENKENPKGDE